MSDDATHKNADSVDDLIDGGQTTGVGSSWAEEASPSPNPVARTEEASVGSAEERRVVEDQDQASLSPQLNDELTRIDAELMDCVQEYLGWLPPSSTPDATRDERDNVGEGKSHGEPDQTGDAAWEGYEDSGGWRTLAGNHQVDVEPRYHDHGEDDDGVSSGESSIFLDDVSAESGSNLAKFVGIRGADAGRHLALNASDVSIGRSAASAIVLSESSVSRQHARVERRDDGFWVIDLESGNGTYVNGERIHESWLRSGDEVCFGNGVFHFVDPRQEQETVDADGASSSRVKSRAGRSMTDVLTKPRTLYVASAALLLLSAGLVVATKLVSEWRQDRLNSAFNSWLLGVENFSNNRWNQSAKAFAESRSFVPGYKNSTWYLDVAHRERKASKSLDEARAALKSDDLQRARELALQVAGSVAYGEEADRVLTAVELAAKRRIDRVRSALRAGRFAQAKQLLEDAEFLSLYWPEVGNAQARLREREKNKLRRGR